MEDLAKKPSCAIDIADDGPKSLAEVAEILGVSRVAVVFIERKAKAKLAKLTADEYDNGLPPPRSRY